MGESACVVTLLYPMYLLAEPEFGSRALALLDSGASLTVSPAEGGFLRVRSDSAVEGYLPAAACAPLAARNPQDALKPTQVVQPVSLYRRPTPGSQFAAPWIVSPDETLQVIGREFQFVRIQRQDGQVGYVPELACGTMVAAAHGPYPTTRLRQPVALYSSPSPGGQISSKWILSPEETLLVLGREAAFLLVQRDDGQIGFVPAVLCGQMAPDQYFKVGPLDLVWIAMGGSWLWANWLAMAIILQQSSLVGPALAPYLGIGLLLSVASLIWFASWRRYAARSFSIGVLLGYALMHFASQGTFTLWT